MIVVGCPFLMQSPCCGAVLRQPSLFSDVVICTACHKVWTERQIERHDAEQRKGDTKGVDDGKKGNPV